MHAWQRSTAVGAVPVAALATSITSASAASSTTRWVDADGHAGPGGCGGSAAASRHIQQAVTASNADDTVIVLRAWHLRPDGSRVDCVVYSLLRDDEPRSNEPSTTHRRG